jgi:hypothetical protein
MTSLPPAEPRTFPPASAFTPPTGTTANTSPTRRALLGVRRADLAALTALLALTVTLPALYVAAERVVYSSDYAGFHNAAVDTALELRARLATGVHAVLGLASLVRRSTGWDYSLLPAVLPAPIMLALHGGRVAYIVTCAVLYLMPFVLLLGATAALLAPDRRREAFWTAVAVAAALPALWLPTLRGYPDAGAAALVTGALAVFLGDMQFRRRRTAAAIGVLLAVAILFRRHFAYPALSLFVVIGACGLLSAVERLRGGGRDRSAARAAAADVLAPATTALWCAGTLLLLGRPFVSRALSTNYTELYASYMRSPPVIAGWLFDHFGWAAWILTIAGYVAAWRSRVLDRRRLGVVLGTLLLTLGLWTFRVRQIGAHYALHVVPLVALGQFALAWTVGRRMRGVSRALLVTGAICYAAVNAARGLAPVGAVPPPLESTRWLAASTPPLRWADYGEMLRLVHDLRRVAGRSDPVYVAASGDLRASTLRSADRMLDDPFRRGARARELQWGSRLYVPHTPHVDSRDDNPTGALLRAHYVVVATPVQYHLDPDEQRSVRAAVEAFTTSWPLADDFEILPGSYTLADGARVSVYRRTRPSAERVALETFARVRAALRRAHERPLVTYLGSRTDVASSGSGPRERTVSVSLSSDTAAFVVADSGRPGSHLRATVQTTGAGCAQARISVASLPGDTLSPDVSPVEAARPPQAGVDLPLRGAGSSVLLRVWRDSIPAAPAGRCVLTLADIAVTRAPAR